MSRFLSRIRFALLLSALLSLSAQGSAQVSRFCQGCLGSRTLGEEMKDRDVVVVATLRDQHPAASGKKEAAYRPVTYEVAQIIKGGKLVSLKQLVPSDYYSDASAGQPFLVMATKDGGTLTWHTAVPLSPPLEAYITKLFKLGADDKESYLFFQSYLEHQDDSIARDAYDELAKLSYAKFRGMRDEMPHDSLVAWIQAKETPTTHRRLYLQMLGVCGREQDIPMLVDEIVSEDPKKKRGLDAVIGCFLTLRGKAGLPLVEKRFLSNKKADYPDVYSAIMALRFHATEEKIIHHEDLLRGFRHILERPDLADLVIPDLVRLEDWEPAERLAELFKTADENSIWVRVPVINYLRACPLPIADKLLRECEELDPKAAERARRVEPVVEKKPLRVARGK